MMLNRPRRLRQNSIIRKMSRETRISKDSLIMPVFIREGKNIIENINSLDGQKRYSPDTISKFAEEYLKKGINSFMLFGLPTNKDEKGSSAYDKNGVIQTATRELKKQFGEDIYIITDTCLCGYTSHGHCGMLKNNIIDNDSSLSVLAKVALSQAEAGSDMVAPSDMMDGRIKAIRKILEENNFCNTSIMSYSAKYASSFYGPFREAAESAPQIGDRKSYQMDFHNSKEAIKEVLIDEEEGADIIIIKPALSYLDIIYKASTSTNLPIAAYSVSGEYAMIKAAGKQNLVDEYKIMCETSTSIFRSGANILITYFAKELSEAIRNGDIG